MVSSRLGYPPNLQKRLTSMCVAPGILQNFFKGKVGTFAHTDQGTKHVKGQQPKTRYIEVIAHARYLVAQCRTKTGVNFPKRELSAVDFVVRGARPSGTLGPFQHLRPPPEIAVGYLAAAPSPTTTNGAQ